MYRPSGEERVTGLIKTEKKPTLNIQTQQTRCAVMATGCGWGGRGGQGVGKAPAKASRVGARGRLISNGDPYYALPPRTFPFRLREFRHSLDAGGALSNRSPLPRLLNVAAARHFGTD